MESIIILQTPANRRPYKKVLTRSLVFMQSGCRLDIMSPDNYLVKISYVLMDLKWRSRNIFLNLAASMY